MKTQPGAAAANCTSDPYFGKKIAGGHYVSGEASYIEKIGKYWFLFMSYGGFAPDGGYQMRISVQTNLQVLIRIVGEQLPYMTEL